MCWALHGSVWGRSCMLPSPIIHLLVLALGKAAAWALRAASGFSNAEADAWRPGTLHEHYSIANDMKQLVRTVQL